MINWWNVIFVPGKLARVFLFYPQCNVILLKCSPLSRTNVPYSSREFLLKNTITFHIMRDMRDCHHKMNNDSVRMLFNFHFQNVNNIYDICSTNEGYVLFHGVDVWKPLLRSDDNLQYKLQSKEGIFEMIENIALLSIRSP